MCVFFQGEFQGPRLFSDHMSSLSDLYSSNTAVASTAVPPHQTMKSQTHWRAPALETLLLLPSLCLLGGVVCSNTSSQGRLIHVLSPLSV